MSQCEAELHYQYVDTLTYTKITGIKEELHAIVFYL